MGQPPLSLVGFQKSFCALLLAHSLHHQCLLQQHLVVDHLHDPQMDQYCYGQTKGQHHIHHAGHFTAAGYHQHDVQHHNDARKKGHDQHLQRGQRLLPPPAPDNVGCKQASPHNSSNQQEQAAAVAPDFPDGNVLIPGKGVADCIFRQQAHNAVDKAGRELLVPASAEKEHRDQQVDNIQNHRFNIEKANVMPDRGHQKNCCQQGGPQAGKAESPAAAQKCIFHHDKGRPLANADQMPHQKPEHFLSHRQTAPSIPDRCCGSQHSRSGSRPA